MFSYSVRYQVEDAEVLQTNGWPNAIWNSSGAVKLFWLPEGFGNGEPLRRLAARSYVAFSVAVPTEHGVTWRVPLMYQKNRVGIERWWSEVVLRAVYDLRGGKGPPFYPLPWSVTNSPEMVGMPNESLQRMPR